MDTEYRINLTNSKESLTNQSFPPIKHSQSAAEKSAYQLISFAPYIVFNEKEHIRYREYYSRDNNMKTLYDRLLEFAKQADIKPWGENWRILVLHIDEHGIFNTLYNVIKGEIRGNIFTNSDVTRKFNIQQEANGKFTILECISLKQKSSNTAYAVFQNSYTISNGRVNYHGTTFERKTPYAKTVFPNEPHSDWKSEVSYCD